MNQKRGADDDDVGARGQKGAAIESCNLTQVILRNHDVSGAAHTMNHQYAASYATSKDENTIKKTWQRLVRQSQYDAKGRPRTRLALVRRRLLTLPSAIFALWFFVLLWGERSAFSSSIDACAWDKWENWVCWKHSVVFICVVCSCFNVALGCPTTSHCSNRRPSTR